MIILNSKIQIIKMDIVLKMIIIKYFLVYEKIIINFLSNISENLKYFFFYLLKLKYKLIYIFLKIICKRFILNNC